MEIKFEPITKDYLPPKSGTYLVRTVSTGPLKRVQFITTRVEKIFKEKSQSFEYSIDCHNQIPTDISIEPIL